MQKNCYHFLCTMLSKYHFIFIPFCPIPFCPYTLLSVPFCPLPFCLVTLSSTPSLESSTARFKPLLVRFTRSTCSVRMPQDLSNGWIVDGLLEASIHIIIKQQQK